MTDGTELLISGGGTVGVSTDAMRADSERLRALSAALPTVSISLRSVAALAGPADAIALGSWRASEADAAFRRARTELQLAIEQCGQIVDALEAAAVNYEAAETEAMARIVSLSEQLAAGAGSLVGDAAQRNPGLARALAHLAARAVRQLVGNETGPGDIELPDDINAILSDPRVVRLLRGVLMAGDDFVGGVVDIPPSLRDSTSEVGLTAVVVMALGAMAGLFRHTPVSTARVGAARPAAPVVAVADRAARIPSAVAGDAAQVRIETYSAPGKADRFEVYIGGTVDFSPLVKDEPFDLTSNLQLEAGLPSGAYEGVRQAMALAGIDGDSEVVLVGHSQGGLIASALAASGDYRVDALVTFGAPAGQIAIPASVPALVVENVDDVVPALGGIQSNEHALVVRARAYPDGIPPDLALPAHHIEAYIATAEAIDERAESAQVVAFRQRLAGLTSGYDAVSAQRYLVTRTT